jgi:outer membrane protein W
VGLGNVGDASLAFGGRFEKAIKQVPDLGNGIIGIQAAVDYYSWSASGTFSGTRWESSVTYLPIGVTANYHFDLENNRIDPFLGLGLGYQIISSDCNYSGAGFSYDCGFSSSSTLYFIGRAGIRYFLSRLALYADAGAGAATLNVGAMFKIN